MDVMGTDAATRSQEPGALPASEADLMGGDGSRESGEKRRAGGSGWRQVCSRVSFGNGFEALLDADAPSYAQTAKTQTAQ